VTPLTPPPDAVVFDLDGVIIDSREAVRVAAGDALAAHGLKPRPPHELDRLIGPPTAVGFADLAGATRDSELVGALVDTYHERYDAVYIDLTTLVDGIAGVLRALPVPLAIATSKPVAFVAPLLSHLGIASVFESVSAPGMTSLEEPKRETVARALADLACERGVIVGDRAFDIDAAHANRIRGIGVTWGIGDRAELEGAGADAIVEDPSELVALLGA
jgi:phosphoglycolate phosphatase